MNKGIGDVLLLELTSKHCYVCKVYKAHVNFGKDKVSLDGLSGACKDCRSIRRRADYARDRGKECKYNQLRRYSMTSSVFSTLEKKQKGKCAICIRVLVRPYVDHNHKMLQGKEVMRAMRPRSALWQV